MKEKLKNKKVMYTIIGIIAILLVVIGVTYAYWLITRTQSQRNIATTACLDISLTDEENDITLTNQFPLSDEDGASLTPYEFTVTNNCNTSIDYHINLEAIGTESEAIISSAIKAKLDENNPQLLYNYVATDTTITNAYEAYVLGYGTLTSSGTTGSSASHSLRIWIDENAPISEMNKTFRSKITAIVGQGISSQGNTLASLILNHAKTNNYLYTTAPDFSEVTSDGEYGLYSAQDDYGTSYYFRGDVENNIVKFGPKRYVSTFIPKNAASSSDICGNDDPVCSTLVSANESLVFQTKEECIAYGKNGSYNGHWDECEETNLESVYVISSYTPTYVSERAIGFQYKSLCDYVVQNSGDLGGVTCSERTVNQELIKKYDTPLTWRIIRINGDGTIRMIYNGNKAVVNDVNNLVSSIQSVAYNDAKYAGYTYDDGNGNQIDSTIKGVVDEWYTNYLEKDWGKYIADSIFCNDREIISTTTKLNYYGAYDRLKTNKSPVLTCTNQNDRYTVEDTTKGNGLLTKPIGLITADEVSMAGGVYHTFIHTNYLYNGDIYWTMSPGSYSKVTSRESVWYISSGLYYCDSDFKHQVRPVINLKANTLFTGSGTIDDPYKIVTE